MIFHGIPKGAPKHQLEWSAIGASLRVVAGPSGEVQVVAAPAFRRAAPLPQARGLEPPLEAGALGLDLPVAMVLEAVSWF